MNNFESSFSKNTINSHISDRQQDAGQQIKPIPENKIEKVAKEVLVKAAIGTGVVGMGLGLAACSPAEAVEPTDVVVMTTVEPTDSPAPEMTPAVDLNSAIETNDQTETMDTDQPEKKVDFSELLALAPDVEGLNKETQDNKVLYTYQEGNPYGGEVGEYAGVYKDNVTVEGEKVGGVCMEAKVCQKLLEDALAEVPEGEPKVKVIVPLDITNYDGNVQVEAVHYNEAVWYACLFNGELPFVSAYPGTSDTLTAYALGDNRFFTTDDGQQIDSTLFILNRKTFSLNPGESLSGNEKLIFAVPKNGSSLEGPDMGYSNFFGQEMCQVESSITVGFVDSSELGTVEASLSSNSFLRFDNGSLVFIEGSK